MLPDRDFRGPALTWIENGCGSCRARWERRDAREPRELGSVPLQMSEYFRCAVCGAYWESGVSNPHEIAAEQGRLRVPDLADRERAAGLR